ncbi:hypothetical protein F4780DRAFT_683655 [Xylariomycetidae sp. FL0641]|nr:hypothetical protein F4780DRAFT_683655 [Xylariomycetidae sp. FL0641]
MHPIGLEEEETWLSWVTSVNTMEAESITSDCVALAEKIARALTALAAFVREVREARSDVDGVSRELHSLQTVLELLKEDAGLFPAELAGQAPAVIAHCSEIVDKLDESLSTMTSAELSRQAKRARWLDQGRKDIALFRSSLEAHKCLLGLALDLVGATTIRDVTSAVEPGNRNTIQRRQHGVDVVEDVARILVEMEQLRMRLMGHLDKAEANSILYDYMNDLKSYAVTIVDDREREHEAEQQAQLAKQKTQETEARERRPSEQGAFVGEQEQYGAYVGDAPDSAIEINIEPAPRKLADLLVAKDSREEMMPTIDETLMNPLSNVPSRAPTPPPKDAKRMEAIRNNAASPFDTLSSLADTATYGVVTEISAGSIRNERPLGSKSRALGKLFKAPFRNAGQSGESSNYNNNNDGSSNSRRPHTRSTSSTGASIAGSGSIAGSALPAAEAASADMRPSTPVIQASVVRRGSRRLSVSFRKLPLWSGELALEEPEGTNTNAVFGVSLQKSMQVAKGSSKTHHSGGKGGSSRRDFPLCMQKCTFFLKNEGGVSSPDIFAEPGDAYRVAKLKEIFSSGPGYGEDINWASFSAYDAADLVLLYLSQLPKPLIPESLAKKWISISRQATLSGSHATRLDQCIDFWEEALGGLRGPSRSLFKLLLNLWADIAEAADINDMTAERLAGVVLKPLIHGSSPKYETDFMLSLAFLIRRRSEYTHLLKKEPKKMAEAKQMNDIKRISKAAW